MDGWVLWLIVAVIFALGELHTTGFFLGPFAVGAVLATLLSAAGAGAVIEWAVFLVVSLILLAALFALAGAGTAVSIVVFAVITARLFLFVRPVARRHP